MARILVVYYSRTGTTERVSTEIASALDADREGISEPTKRLGAFGYARSAVEGTFQWTTKIGRVLHDPADYDLVVLGSPTWNASLSSPLRSFIRQYRNDLKAVAFFCTCGGSGGERVLEHMSLESGKSPVAALILREGEVTRGSVGPAIQQFTDRIRASSAVRDASSKLEDRAGSP